MNSIPKQQEGDGSDAAAANGSRATLEQTVLGVTPSAPAAAPEEAGSGAASDEPLPATPSVVIVAAPMIAVSSSGAAPPARPDEAESSSAAPAVSTPGEAVSRTLLVDASTSSAPERPFTTPRYGTPTPSSTDGQQSTVLNDDYLRSAREAAFAQPSVSAAARAAASEAPSPSVGPGAAEENTSASTATTRPSMAPPSWAAALPGSSDEVGSSTIRGFEPVPVLRAPLAESLSGGLMAVSELGGKGLPRGARPLPRLGAPPRGDVKSRWMLLCAVAFAVVGLVSFGGRLLNRYRSTTERTRALSAHETAPPHSEPLAGEGLSADGAGTAGSASRALLANRPASERGLAAGRATVISASSAPVDVPPGSAAVTSPQSQLAATAGRLMLAGSYAEALPVYRQLAREWPENTSYAAMARLLEKRIGSMNDTRTIAPATP